MVSAQGKATRPSPTDTVPTQARPTDAKKPPATKVRTIPGLSNHAERRDARFTLVSDAYRMYAQQTKNPSGAPHTWLSTTAWHQEILNTPQPDCTSDRLTSGAARRTLHQIGSGALLDRFKNDNALRMVRHRKHMDDSTNRPLRALPTALWRTLTESSPRQALVPKWSPRMAEGPLQISSEVAPDLRLR